MVLNACEKNVLDGAFSEDGILSNHACIITRFLVLFDISIPKKFLSCLTVIPWFGFSDDDHKIKYSYLESKFSKNELKDQVVKDVKSGSVDFNTLEHHIDFLRECKCNHKAD